MISSLSLGHPGPEPDSGARDRSSSVRSARSARSKYPGPDRSRAGSRAPWALVPDQLFKKAAAAPPATRKADPARNAYHHSANFEFIAHTSQAKSEEELGGSLFSSSIFLQPITFVWC